MPPSWRRQCALSSAACPSATVNRFSYSAFPTITPDRLTWRRRARASHRLRDRSHLAEIGALELAVAVHVRVHERGDAAVVEQVDRLRGGHLGRLRPARGGDEAAAHVDGDDDPRSESGHDLVEEVDVAEGGGPDDRALRAAPQRVAHGVDGPQAAAVLHRDAGPLRDPAQVLEGSRLALLGAVEVDDVQVPGAGVDPALGRLQRVVVVRRGVLEPAFHEANRPAAHDVDRRIEDHAATRS
jgi:hypothetical protein